MSEYLSPGVYVQEIPSAVKPIAGVSTSTACFLGIVPADLEVPEENPKYDPTGRSAGDDTKVPFVLKPVKFLPPDELKKRADAVAGAQKAFNENKDPKETKKLLEALQKTKDERSEAEARAENMTPVLCTNFGEFKRHFGDFSTNPQHNQLAHAVFGFFNNGGTRCFVMRFATLAELQDSTHLVKLEAIDEISLVVAPGITDAGVQQAIVDHCTNMKDRFAILDPPEVAEKDGLTTDTILKTAKNTDFGAIYFPRIRVFDIVTKLTQPDSDGEIYVAPSGHIAGIYARVDHERGVHKAPANEVVRGALDVEFQVSKGVQDGLNPHGVNCIRNINGNIKVWGARTIGGDANSDLKYINVRRTLLFIEESIDEGTQWVVFEPNDRSLWAKIERNVSAFLTVVWRDGALFGRTPQEAFYVKCDDETNPPENRELGRVTTEIGVAIVRPAEFVIFRITQWQPQPQ
jgi:uncharacterized protein